MTVPTDAVVARWAARGRAEWASARGMDALADRVAALVGEHEVVAALRAAADDERRHGGWCDDLVARLGGRRDDRSEEPGLPPTFSTHPRAAVIEHVVYLLCAGETVAAAMLGAIADRATAPGVTALLRDVAADEARHGALGWRVLDALLDNAEPEVRAGLAEAAPRQAMRAVIAAERVRAEPDDDATVAWGVPSSATTAHLAKGVVGRHVAPELHRRGLWPAP